MYISMVAQLCIQVRVQNNDRDHVNGLAAPDNYTKYGYTARVTPSFAAPVSRSVHPSNNMVPLDRRNP